MSDTLATNVPQPVYTPAGFQVPLESAILAGVTADINAAYGTTLDFATGTPQLQLAQSWAAICGDCNNQFLSFIANVDPATSAGRMQDAIGYIYFILRIPAQATSVVCNCIGGVGVVIPTGALVEDTAGNLYACLQGGTIGSTGIIQLTFDCVVAGPTACPAASLTTIYRTIPGWDAVSNPNDGTVGHFVETRAAFEARRSASVAINAQTIPASILAAILELPGVIDAYVVDNPDNTVQVVGGVALDANSVFICVSGGAPAQIAAAILTKKPPGCSYNGNVTYSVADPSPLYETPPIYPVSWQQALSNPITFLVQIANSLTVPSNAGALIQAAVLAAFAGSDGGPRARIGGTIYASRFYAGIAALGAWAQIITLQIGSLNSPSALVTGSITGSTMTVTALSLGAIGLGMTIIGNNVPAGTVVTAGTGGVGTYTVSPPLLTPVGSEPLAALLPNLNSATMLIDQIPVTSAAYVYVQLI